jgi:hypothetical protein
MQHFAFFLRIATLSLVALVCDSIDRAHAATTLCAPFPVSSGAAANVVNPATGIVYTLDGRGCASFNDIDVPYFLTQGYTPPGSGGGGGGGGTARVTNIAALATAVIPATQTSMVVAAMAATGHSTCSLLYTVGTATPTGVYGEVLNTVSNLYWEPQYDNAPVRACQFGTVADGTFNFALPPATPVYGGTDNTLMIQAALDYAMQNNFKTVCLTDGTYMTTDTIALGWGYRNNTAVAHSLALIACNSARAAYDGFAGVTLYPTKYDRCAINISGGRQTRINGIHIAGGNYGYAATRYSNANLPVATTAAGWLDPNVAPGGSLNPGTAGGLTQWAPYGGICIDAYNGGSTFTGTISGTALTATAVANMNPIPIGFVIRGPGVAANTTIASYLGGPNYTVSVSQTVGPVAMFAEPAVHYPDQTFPAWLNNTNGVQYNQAGSTDTIIENVVVEGFAVGVAIGIGPGQQNGDFNTLKDAFCNNIIYCVSFGSSQSRGSVMQNFHCSNVYTFLTNLQFGSKAGELGGNVTNVQCGQMYQFFDIALSVAGTTVQDIYVEGGIKIGNISGGSITLRNCVVSIADTITGVVVPAMIEAGTGGLSIRLDDCKIAGGSRITTLVHYPSAAGTVTVNGGVLNGGTNVGTLMGTTGSQNAVNYTGGYFAGASVFPNSTNGYTSQLAWQGQSSATNMTTPTVSSPGLTQAGWTAYPVLSAARQNLTQAMQGFYDGAGDFKYWPFLRGAPTLNADLTSNTFFPTAGVPLTLATCDTWTGQWAASQQGTQNGQLSPGDIFYHLPTGTILVVESIGAPNPTHYPVILRQHNNMSVNALQTGGTAACTVNNLGSVGATPPSGNTTLVHVGEPTAVSPSTLPTVAAGGSGYSAGPVTLTLVNPAAGSPGWCATLPQISVNTTAGAVTSVNSVTVAGQCYMRLPNPVATTGGGGTGATLNITYTQGMMAISGTVIYCDFVQGTLSLTNCDNGAGSSAGMVAALLPGDKFWGSPLNDPSNRWPFQAGSGQINVLSSVTAGTAAFTGPGASRTGRFPLLPFQVADSGYPDRSSRGAIANFNGMIQAPLTFASLPAATAGTLAYITNGLATNCGDTTCTTFGTTVTGGGGALKLLLWYNGTNWTLFGK